MKQPKISVVIVYNNCESSIAECLNSVLNQSFSGIEIICINSGSTDKSEEIVNEIAASYEDVKLISLPNNDDIEFAKQTGLGVVSSDFVCFVNGDEVLSSDFIKEKYFEVTKTKIKQIQNKHLYRRAFLENDVEVVTIIQQELEQRLKSSAEIIKEQKQEIKEEFNKFYQNNVETIKNNSYEVISRFNQLEKLFYEKDYENKSKIDGLFYGLSEHVNGPVQKIYEDISKVYDYINAEINKKGCEVNRIYEDITKNYSYTEEIVAKTAREAKDLVDYNVNSLSERLTELEKEIVFRYVNLKRLFDMQLDELDSKVKAESSSGSVEVVSLEKIVSENMDKIYSRLNESSSIFYEELSKIYKQLNEKLMEKSAEDRYFMEQKVSELRMEFEQKLQKLKEEIIG